MRVLILSCNTGEGHNSAGKAVAEAVVQAGHESVMLDIMLLSGKKASTAVGGAYVGIVKHAPGLFKLLYRLGGLISSSKRKSPVYYANSLMVKHLRRFLAENHFDIIVTPHLFAAETLTCMKKKGLLEQKTVSIATDYTCIPFFEETECDYCIVPHKDLIDEFVSKGMKREQLIPYGIPVRAKFLEREDKREARRKCHLPEDKPAFLVMSGSMGFGKIHLFVARLALKCEEGEQIVIICGNNKKLEYILKKEFRWNENIHILGYTEKVSRYMDACDVIFTKPGGLTSTEAAVKNIAMVHTTPIPGCETKNRIFFTQRKMSYASDTIKDQIGAGMKLMNHGELRDKMREAQRHNCNPEAAKQIADFLLKLCGEERK